MCGTDSCYTPGQFRAMFSSMLCSGGVAPQPEDALQVLQSAGMNVIVRPGTAYIESDTPADGTYYHVINDADVAITIGASDPTDDRIDLIVADVDPTTCSWELTVIQGAPSPVPTAPALGNNQIALAEVYVAAGVTDIIQGNITDRRVEFSLCQNGPQTFIFEASGTFDPTLYPSSARVKVECIGGGGGGGGFATTSASECASGSGGGGGGYGMGWVPISDMGGLPVAVTVGAGGGNGTSGGSQPSAGGNSSFGAFVIGNGGGAGTSSTATSGTNSNETGGTGGFAGGTHLQLQIGGQAGRNGVSSGSNNMIPGYGFGGSAARGGGGGKLGAVDNTETGGGGQTPGGGGAGGFARNSQSFGAGGNGARGVVIVEVWA
jgi:hypothetical protein